MIGRQRDVNTFKKSNTIRLKSPQGKGRIGKIERVEKLYIWQEIRRQRENIEKYKEEIELVTN